MITREALLQEVDAQYRQQRELNQAEQERRLAEAVARDERIGELWEERRAIFQDRARQAFASPQDAHAISGALRGQLESLHNALRARLRACGLPEAYLQPVYRCPLCRDTGYVGEPVRERCACFTQRMQALVSARTGDGLNGRETFAAYDDSVFSDEPLSADTPETQRSYMQRLRQRCESYAELFPNNPRRNLLMVGMSGLGKTFLLNCIGNRVRERGHTVVKLTAYQLTERMRASIFEHDVEPFRTLLTVPLLLLDDLGVEPLLSNITIEQLFTLINERDLDGLHTVVSTNLMPEELQERYTERICSRLFDKRAAAMLRFVGKDVRLGSTGIVG